MIRRIANKERWCSIAPGPIEDTKLSWQARGLLVYLLSRPDDWEVSDQQLIHASPDGRTVVQSCLQELAQHGYAKLTQHRDERRHRATGKRWEISEVPDISEKSLTDRKPDSQETCRTENLTDRKPDSQETCLITYDLKTEPMIDKNLNTLSVKSENSPPENSQPPINKPKESKPKTDVMSQAFLEFWQAYPRKVGKPEAWRSWKKLCLDQEKDRIIASVRIHQEWDSAWREMQYIPHPSTYLNKGYYDDELATTHRQVRRFKHY